MPVRDLYQVEVQFRATFERADAGKQEVQPTWSTKWVVHRPEELELQLTSVSKHHLTEVEGVAGLQACTCSL